MKSYINYFQEGGNVRIIKRYITSTPEKEIPNNQSASYFTWLLWKLKQSYANKETNVTPSENISVYPSNTSNNSVVNIYSSNQNSSDTISVNGRTFIINNKQGS